MSSKTANSIAFPYVLALLSANVKRQRSFIRNTISRYLKEAESTNDGTLTATDHYKIKTYYGIGVPAILGECFCILRGSKMTPRERLVSTCLGAITGLGDDFFDRHGTSPEMVREFILNPLSVSAERSNEKLFVSFYSTALEHAGNTKGIIQKLETVLQAQIMSKKQLNPDIPYTEIKRITFEKGGHSLLFYRQAFGNETTEAERDLLFQLGGIMQLGNDIFDVYEDIQDGVFTLVTTEKDIKNLVSLFQDTMVAVEELTMNSFPEKKALLFLRYLAATFYGRVMVCLEMLEKVQQSDSGVFSPHTYDRSRLICDMEKPSNLMRSFKIGLTYPKLQDK